MTNRTKSQNLKHETQNSKNKHENHNTNKSWNIMTTKEQSYCGHNSHAIPQPYDIADVQSKQGAPITKWID